MCSSFLVGMLLSQSGSLIQLGTRNILSSPSTLGLDGLAVLWLLVLSSLGLYFQFDLLEGWGLFLGLPLFILLGMVFTAFIKGSGKYEKIILIGITFNLLVGALFSLWQFLFMAFNLPFPIELWFGHFRFASKVSLLILVLCEFFVLFGLSFYLKRLKLFSLGPVVSRAWNLDEKKLFQFIFIAVAGSTYIVISLFGAFSFLALIFPILGRKLWFKRWDLPGELYVGSFINGLFLMLVDFLCYFFPILGAEVPVGLIVTTIGALSLIVVLWSNSKDSEIVANPKK
jgi:iron complex transport system permease protein